MVAPGPLPPRLAPLLALSLAAAPAVSAQENDPRADEGARLFEAEVRPVLAEHCVSCHGGDDPKGGLRLDTVEGLRAGAGPEPLWEAGDPDASLVVEALRHDDPFLAMPPDGKLADDEIAAVERWIAAGAHLPESVVFEPAERVHWCFRPPVDPAVEARAGQDPIDALIERRLAAEGIEPSPPAGRLPWLRRVTFDLTGLPPTPAEVEAFLADDAPGADERVVDRLLASPAFGERWARRWLDLVRYAETKAHEFDHPIPNAWAYRDYVIRAFDADVPYDRLVTELIAGDLVEEPRMDQDGRFDESPLGTGAWFLGEEVHSPVEPRGDQTDRVAHQVEVLSKAVLGLGVSCARCHDHKFDPISAEDYHALAGFAISTAPRQLRYETDAANRALAAELRAFEGALRPRAAAALAAALRAEAAEAERILALAELAGTAAAAVDPGDPRGELERLSARLAGGASAADVLLEDFESGDLAVGGLAPWTRTGDAFAAAPIHRDGIDHRQTGMEPRGAHGVNSFSGHGPDARGDTFLGTLTSAPFTLRHRYLHLLVNGGKGAGTRIEVIDAATEEVLADLRGQESNVYRPRTFDLGEHPGRAVRVRVVDEAEGSWGHIGLDHLVASSRPDAARALDRALAPAAWLRLVAADPEGRLAGWLAALEDDAPPALGRALRGEAPPPPGDAPLPRVLVDHGALSGARWSPNGPGFGPGPVAEGALGLAVEDGALRVASVASRPAAAAHPAWDGLEVHPDSTFRRGSKVTWVQAGRTLAAPGLRCETGRVAHLVRGEGRLLTSIASHRLVAGPLHGPALKAVDTGRRWTWLVQEIPSAKGLHVHCEWTAKGPEPFEVALTVELAEGESPPPLRGAVRLFEGDEDAPAGAAARLGRLLELAAELVERGGVGGRVLEDDERAALLDVADFVARRVARVRGSVAAALEGERAAFEELLGRRRMVSRLAPAALDLEGRDERVLDRGDWRAPLGRAPRRAPRALLAADAPACAADGEGSGRLALARSLLASETRIVQRVWANRLWQAMFGRGIVATPDDFGAMGAAPTHPELLDHLALSLERGGWSTKGMLRRLALTDAYRRSTSPSPSALELDEAGALLAHARPRRLEAEEIRDALLAASGELDPARFGRPVPIHLTPFMTGRGRPGTSGPLDGDRRRSLYLEVRRNFPHPFLTVFDLPTPSTCHGRRSSANVPAQALAMLNDPFVEGRARALGALAAGSGDLESGATLVWRRALGRAPGAEEHALVERLAAGADDLEAALTDVAHAVFNSKEFLFLR